jgi:hypothetical protein
MATFSALQLLADHSRRIAVPTDTYRPNVARYLSHFIRLPDNQVFANNVDSLCLNASRTKACGVVQQTSGRCLALSTDETTIKPRRGLE